MTKFKYVFTRYLHFHWLFAACIVLAAACDRRPAYPDKLVQAEKIINVHPDSALSLLQSMDVQLENEPEETRMYHTMLTIKAKDKLYIPHTSDSLILPVVHFYEKYGDKERLAEAYFYLGSTYRDMNDALRALKVFHRAAETGEKSGMNQLLGMIYGNMGSLFTSPKYKKVKMIPGSDVDRMKGEVSTFGQTVSLYIDGKKVDYREIQSLRPQDITKVEYIDAPSGKYVGEIAAT